MNEVRPQLFRRIGAGRQRNLVFTSAGDRTNAARWLRGRKNFDLWIAYYGESAGQFRELADIYHARRGSKFANLKFAYDTWPELLAPYKAVLVTDDDVLISGDAISRLFDLQEQRDLWLLQAAFSPLGKISWRITRVRWQYELRFTNFVEMTCPLFRKDKLDAFMAVYDPILAGEGTDWWFMETLGPDIGDKVAIVDAITCVNVHDRTKGGVREISRLQSRAQRQEAWQIVKAKHKLERKDQREFRRILKPIPNRWLSPLVHAPLEVYVALRRRAGIVKRAVAHWWRQQ